MNSVSNVLTPEAHTNYLGLGQDRIVRLHICLKLWF